MQPRHGSRQFFGLALALGACAAAVFAEPPAESRPAPQLADFKTAGRKAALTVYPAALVGRPMRQVGDAIALMLEKSGMDNLVLDAPEFRPPADADLAQTAKAFGEFVRGNPPKTDFALLADLRGSREKGFEEVLTIVVNRAGEPVWQDRQTAADDDFKRIAPQEPLQCCILVVDRLRPVLSLPPMAGEGGAEGPIARRWREKAGAPDQSERAGLDERARKFKTAAAQAKLLVYPALAGDEFSADSAAQLVRLLSEAKLTQPTAAKDGPRPDVPGDANEQKVLWDMARKVRAYVQAHQPEADYVLFPHYLLGKDSLGRSQVGGVHFVVCDRAGQLVLVDFQNDHHADFNAVAPSTRADCDRLVAKRLAGYCK